MGNKSSILIVDDDLGTCETLSDILEVSGFEISSVTSGEECIELLKKQHFDIVLMDIKMQGLNGVETFRELKKTAKDTRVIMMTAYAVNDLVAEAIEEGAFSVVHKPLDLDNLISLVRG